jgi:hypothetical protein
MLPEGILLFFHLPEDRLQGLGKRGVIMMLNIVYKMIVKVLSGASPEIRNQIKAFLADLEEKAKQTSNPVDDILVLCLRIVLGF